MDRFQHQVAKAACGALAAIGFAIAHAEGTETLGTPAIGIASGSGLAVGGTGLIDGQPGTISIEVPAGATVNQVLLYLEGTNSTIAETTTTMDVLVDGNPVQTALIGGPTVVKDWVTATYRADITSLGVVGAGSNSVNVGGVDFTVDNDGAGILAIYDDGSDSTIDIRDGNDYAFFALDPPLDVTDPQTFTFPKSPKDRVANIDFFVASVSGGVGSGASCRPNSFEVRTGGNTAVFSDQLDSLDGLYWDTVSLAVTVPKGETSLAVEVFSRDDKVACPGNVPASLDWLAAGLAVQTPKSDDCWITTGGFHNSGDASGAKDFTFGGNVGPPPRGSWQVIDHNTGDNFHSNDVSIVSCETITLSGPGQPGGKKGFTINQASFEGVGRFNFVEGYPFTGYVQDAGEPPGKKGNDQDYFSITVRDPDTNAVVFETSATLDGGNVQIHPPTGKK